MSARDWELLARRRSCNLLTRDEMEHGKTPTTPTISSIIAAVQCQEALKLLHGLQNISGRGWIFDGLSTEAYQTSYQRKGDCYSHETLEMIVSLDEGADSITIGEVLNKARELLGDDCELELSREVLEKLTCPRCGDVETLYQSLGQVKAQKAWCPRCSDIRREVATFQKLRSDDHALLQRTPASIGIPPMDILIARSGAHAIGFELSGDATKVLGPMADAGLEWV
jgi:adenylyltransferase/sulfurtransferase